MNLHQFSLFQIIIGAGVVVGLLAVIQHWALSRLNGDPADELDNNAGDKDAEILGDVPVRSKVGTPRPRRLQPLQTSQEMSLSGTDMPVPADSLAMAGASAFAKPKESSRADQPAPTPAAKGPTTEAKEDESKASDIPKKTLILPPLSASELAGTTSTKASTAATPPADKGREPGVLPPLSTTTPSLTGAPNVKSAEAKPEPAPTAPLTAPAIEKVADGVVAVGAPVSIAPIGSPAETDDVKKRKTPPTAPGAESPRPGLTIIPKDASAKMEAKPGLAGPVAPMEPAKPIEMPAAKITTSVPPDAKGDAGKSGGRPRIFLPANLPVTTDKPAEESAPAMAAKPVAEPVSPAPAVPVESKDSPKPETPAKVESKGPTPAVVPAPEVKPEPKLEAKVEPKPEPKPELKIEIKPEAKVEPKPEPKVEVKPEPKIESKVEPKADAKPEPKAETPVVPVPAPEDKKPAAPAVPEPVKSEVPAASSGGWLRGMLRRSDAEATPKPEPQPIVAKSEPPALKPEEKAPALPAPAEVLKTPAPEQKPSGETTPAASKAGSTLPAPAAQTPVPAPAPIPVPTPAVPAPAPVAAAPQREVSISTSQPKMAQPESTTNVPANSRASAQLTLGFEITSLQLTPFFKLGAVQLKPLSNVVGLHLIATQTADNPLAAGISFQIDKVELNNDKLAAITLKPLQDAQAAAVPQSKLQVDAVQIGQGGDGAPISVTSSGAASTAVQLLATFSIAAMEFTPAFEIGLLRLEPTSNSVLLRLAPSSRPASLDLPPSFEVANITLGDNAQISGMKLTPGNKPA